MTQDKLAEIIKRLEKLENVIFASKSEEKQFNPLVPKNFIGAKGGILFLIEKNFFNKPCTASETKKAMAENDYHYSHQVIQTALNRLSIPKGPLNAIKEDRNKFYVRRK